MANGIYAVHLHMFYRLRDANRLLCKEKNGQSIVQHRDRIVKSMATNARHKVEYVLHVDLQNARFWLSRDITRRKKLSNDPLKHKRLSILICTTLRPLNGKENYRDQDKLKRPANRESFSTPFCER